MSRDEVKKLMMMIAIEFARFDVSEERIAAWTLILDPVQYVDAQYAVVELLRKARQWPPQAGEVFEAARGIARRRAALRGAELAALPMPHAMAEESRRKCLGLLRDCAANIGRKLGAV